MILKLLGVMDKRNPEKQRLVFEVLENGNLSSYYISSDGSLSNKYSYSFPALYVKKGEHVVLYLKDGVPKTEPFVDGNCHFFFHDRNHFIWNTGDKLQLIHLVNSENGETCRIEI